MQKNLHGRAKMVPSSEVQIRRSKAIPGSLKRTPNAAEALPVVKRKRVRRGNLEDAGKLKTELLEAAHSLYREGGIDAVTLRAVAMKANVSPMTPYRYFGGKSEILAGLWESVIVEVFRIQKSAADKQRDPEKKIRAFVNAYLTFWEKHPEHYRLVYLTDDTGVLDFKNASKVAPAMVEVWEFGRQLSKEWAISLGTDPERAGLATQMRYFLALGFLQSNYVTKRSAAEIEKLRPLIVDESIRITLACLTGKPGSN